MKFPAFTSTLQQFLLMRKAIAEADQRASSVGSAGSAHCRAARSLLAAAESLDDLAERHLGVIALLRQALVFAAHGLALRRQAIDAGTDAKMVWSTVSAFDDVKPILNRHSVESREQIDVLVALGPSADDVDRSTTELRSLKQPLLQTVREVLALLEGDVFAPKRLRAMRIVRWVGVVVGIALLVMLGAKSLQSSHVKRNPNHVNLALGKKVTISSNWRSDTYPPERIVDGDTTQLGCHTESQLEPWVMIELDGTYEISQVKVTNRLDGVTERAVPMRIDISTDGNSFSEFARRTEDFKTWTAKGKSANARYVRLTVIGSTILHLNEVEVY